MNETPWWILEPAPRPEEGIKFVIRKGAMLMLIDDWRYRVYIHSDVISPNQLKVVLVAYRNERRHTDSFDLNDLSHRKDFIVNATQETLIPITRMEHDLDILVRELEQQRDSFLQHLAEESARQAPKHIH